MEELLFPTVDPKDKAKPIAKGLPASPGAVTGAVVFNAAEPSSRRLLATR